MEPYVYRLAILSHTKYQQQIDHLTQKLEVVNEQLAEKNYKIQVVNVDRENIEDCLAEGAFNNVLYFSDLRESSSQYESMVKALVKTSGIHITPVIDKRSKNETQEMNVDKEEMWLQTHTKKNAQMSPTSQIKDEKEENILVDKLTAQATLQLGEAENITENNNEYLKDFIKQCVNMIKTRDEYTYSHSVRVADYSYMIAKQMGYTQKDAQEIFLAGLLHDIGKSAISNEILNKPGKLNDQEYEEMKFHDRAGSLILKPFQKICGKISDVIIAGAEQHHIRGYEASDDKAVIAGQIIKVADCVDTMSSQRDYNNPKNVIDTIRDVWGSREGGTRNTMFGPEMAEAYIVALGKELATIGYDISAFLPDTQKARNEEDRSLKQMLMKHEEEFIPRNPPEEYTESGIKLDSEGHIIHKETAKYSYDQEKALQNEMNFLKGRNPEQSEEDIRKLAEEGIAKNRQEFQKAVTQSNEKHRMKQNNRKEEVKKILTFVMTTTRINEAVNSITKDRDKKLMSKSAQVSMHEK